MKKPAALINLLDDIEPNPDMVGVKDTSRAIITDGSKEIKLNPEDCEKIFQDAGYIVNLYEAIGWPEAAIELIDICLPCEVQDALHETFSSVNEL